MITQMIRRVLYFVAFFILTFPGSLFSDILQGKVVKVDEENNAIEMIWSAYPFHYAPKSIKLSLTENAELRGIKSLKEIQAGDVIVAQAVRQGTKEWEVSKLAQIRPAVF